MRVPDRVVEAVGVEAACASLDAPVPHNSSSAVVSARQETLLTGNSSDQNAFLAIEVKG